MPPEEVNAAPAAESRGESTGQSQGISQSTTGISDSQSGMPAAPQRPEYLVDGFDDDSAQARHYGEFIRAFGGVEGFRSTLSRVAAYEEAERRAQMQQRQAPPPQPAKPVEEPWWRKKADPNDPQALRDYAGRVITELPSILDEATRPYQEKLAALERMQNPIYQRLPQNVREDLESGQVTWEWVVNRWWPGYQAHMQAQQQQQQRQLPPPQTPAQAADSVNQTMKARDASGRFASVGGPTGPKKAGLASVDQLRKESFDDIFARNHAKHGGR